MPLLTPYPISHSFSFLGSADYRALTFLFILYYIKELFNSLVKINFKINSIYTNL